MCLQQVNEYMNPHIKSLSITPVINKFPVTFLHNSPCCFHLLPTALEIMPVPFVAGSYQGARMSVLHQATLLLADSYTLPSTNHKIKADFYLLCNNSTIWEQLENLEFTSPFLLHHYTRCFFIKIRQDGVFPQFGLFIYFCI